MLDQSECKYIEKIIDLTNTDKLIWIRNGDNSFINKDFKYKTRIMNKETKEIEVGEMSIDFIMTKNFVYQRYELKSIFYHKNYISNNYTKPCEFSYITNDINSIEYKLLDRLFALIDYKVNNDEKKIKMNHILTFLIQDF